MPRPIVTAVAACVLLLTASLNLRAGPSNSSQAKTSPSRSVSRVFPQQFGHFNATAPAAPASNPAGAASDALETSEAGLLERMARTYGDGKNEVTVTSAEFRDPSGAYEGYTAGLNPGMKASTAGPVSAVDGNRLMFELGSFLVQISGSKNIGEADLQYLIKDLRAQADTAPLPPVRAYLPGRDLIDGTQRYAQGAAGFANAVNSLGHPELSAISSDLGFATGAEPEVMAAQYASGPNRAVLILVAYPNPQLAEQHLRHLLGVVPGGPAGRVIERKASLLSLIIAPSSSAYSARLRQSINYDTQITWNEPSTTATDPPITSTIVKIFIGTGVFMLVAVVLGVAFGGVRILTKKFFPGKVFDRPEEMDVLQLGLSGKRIDSRDFY
jgi:hypothetical protein